MGSESPLWTGVLVERSPGVLVAGSELPLWTFRLARSSSMKKGARMPGVMVVVNRREEGRNRLKAGAARVRWTGAGACCFIPVPLPP